MLRDVDDLRSGYRHQPVSAGESPRLEGGQIQRFAFLLEPRRSLVHPRLPFRQQTIHEYAQVASHGFDGGSFAR